MLADEATAADQLVDTTSRSRKGTCTYLGHNMIYRANFYVASHRRVPGPTERHGLSVTRSFRVHLSPAGLF